MTCWLLPCVSILHLMPFPVFPDVAQGWRTRVADVCFWMRIQTFELVTSVNTRKQSERQSFLCKSGNRPAEQTVAMTDVQIRRSITLTVTLKLNIKWVHNRRNHLNEHTTIQNAASPTEPSSGTLMSSDKTEHGAKKASYPHLVTSVACLTQQSLWDHHY